MKKLASLFAALVLMLALAAPRCGGGRAAPDRPHLPLRRDSRRPRLPRAGAGRLGQVLQRAGDAGPFHRGALLHRPVHEPVDEGGGRRHPQRLFEDLEGTLMHDQKIWDFYKSIKEQYPETVFHGFDVGHQYNTTGAR